MNFRIMFSNNSLIKLMKGFHTSSLYCANPAKSMKKVMGFTTKKKRNYYDLEDLPTHQMLTKANTHCRNSRSGRRTLVLNKLFMRYITDVLSTGEYAVEYLKHNVEINRVNIAPDFKSLNVFWVAKGTSQDEEIEVFLTKHARYLRHELSSLRVIGMVPLIFFVKDKKYSQILEVESKLAIADFGDDFVATELATKLKTKLELFSSLPTSIKDKVQELDANLDNESTVDESELLKMPQDVLGLNHCDIMNRIAARIKKINVTSVEEDIRKERADKPESSKSVDFTTNKQQREEFQAFLKKQELLRTKMRKLESKYLPDREYMREEVIERKNEYFKMLDSYDKDLDEDDVIENVDDYYK